MKTKLIILIVAWFILFGQDSSTIIKPKVDPNDFISDFESMGHAGLFHMMTANADEIIKPDVVTKCTCSGSGKVSYDGGTSLTDCPCKINGVCNCNKSTTEQNIHSSEKTENMLSIENYKQYLLNQYFVAKATSNSCIPCRQWDKVHKEEFGKVGIEIKHYFEENPEGNKFFQSAGVDIMPKFYICTKIDNFQHSGGTDKYNFKGTGFTLDKTFELMEELDKNLHPNLKNGKFYIRKSTVSQKLNGKEWASKEEYLEYLKDKTDWNLSDLSLYELKSIHDDIQNNELGAYGEI